MTPGADLRRRRDRGGRVAGLLALAALAPHGARAAPGLALSVDVDERACVGVDVAAVRRAVGIELGAEIPPTGGAAPVPPGAVAIDVACAEGTARIRVVDPLTRKTSLRDVDLAGTPPRARSRLLALAIAELAAASWAELATNPAPLVPAAGPPASPPAVKAAREVVETRAAPPTIGLQVLGELRVLARGAPLFGAGVRASSPLRAGPGWRAELTLDGGRVDVANGGATLLAGTALAALTWTAGGRRIALVPSLGVRAGIVRMRGAPDDLRRYAPRVELGPWGGPAAGLGVAHAGARGLLLDLSVDVGYALLGTRGTIPGLEPLTARGPWLGLQVGAGWGR